MQRLNGKETALQIRKELQETVSIRKELGKKTPHLAAVLVGSDGGSLSYVTAKVKACEEIGFESTLIRFDENVSEDTLLSKVNELNKDENIDGFIVQLPLPNHINETKITDTISPNKDVDGFHPMNLGNMMLNLPGFLPATPAGIIELMRRYEIETSGKHCVVVGRSNIVGTPMSVLMSRKEEWANCTVTICHSRTKNIEEITRHTKVKIDVLDPQLKSMRIGGQFQMGETDTLFYVLESGFGISVNKINNHHVQLSVKNNN